jgi:large subunit ribosomal protein L25
MAASDSATLELAARTPEGSRSARRLRREGLVPGTLYGAGDEPRSFQVDARILRNALAHAHAVIEISFDGGQTQPVMVKDLQRHPVRGETVHVDLLRVRLDQTIQTTVTLHLDGADVAPGVKEGGILTQELIHLNVEALPGDVPDAISFDVSDLELHATVTVAELTAPRGVTLLDDPETVAVTITAPSVEPTSDDIEVETQIVGDTGVAEAQAQGDTASEAQQSADASGGS